VRSGHLDLTVSAEVLSSVVIGAGQAGLSSSYHLTRRGIDHLVLDANEAPGGAWQHRWASLTMHDVHGVAELPDAPLPASVGSEKASEFIARYFADYEIEHKLPIVRPVVVRSVRRAGDELVVDADTGRWRAHTLINATGTWRHPFVPYYPGVETFAGEQFATTQYPGAEHFRGKRVIVVGGGLSAVQFLGELRPVTDTLWVTRREPSWRTGEFSPDAGREAVEKVAERVREGYRPRSVVSVTGLMLREQEQEAARLGAYERHEMFSSIVPGGALWPGGRFEPADAIIWATGFRPDTAHLSGLGLRSEHGGIQVGATPAQATTSVVDPRVQLVGYGPSASTIGANRAGRVAALAVRDWLTNHHK
jgi:thioredoxin reductase